MKNVLHDCLLIPDWEVGLHRLHLAIKCTDRFPCLSALFATGMRTAALGAWKRNYRQYSTSRWRPISSHRMKEETHAVR